jgi:IS5 family transposase
MRKQGEQLGFADHVVGQSAARKKRRDSLSEVQALVDWAGLEVLLAPLASPIGRPGYGVLTLFKALLLQAWYGLSDPGLEDALGDRVSFRRFVGLSWDEGTPDHSVISRFRSDLVRHGLDRLVFAAVSGQLEARGLIVKQGTLIDASLIRSAAGAPPVSAADGGRVSPVDPDARWAKKGNKATFGYKLHVAVDGDSGLVRAAEVTSANVNDCVLGPALVQGDEAMVYADKAYDNAAMRERLARDGIGNGVMTRANKHHPVLPPEASRRNRALASVRCRVEKVFGTLKRSYRLDRMRFRGLARNAGWMRLGLIALNLRRMHVLLT